MDALFVQVIPNRVDQEGPQLAVAFSVRPLDLDDDHRQRYG